MMSRSLLCTLLLVASSLTQAQNTASPAKKELVQKLLQLQQPALEGAARNLVERPAAQMMQQAGEVLQTQIPADKREAIGKSIETDVKKYIDETYPLVRERAIKLAPSTVGVVLEEKFTEDELRQLVAWFESPVNRKFQQAGGEMQSSLMQKLVVEARPLVEPKLQALDQKVRSALGAPPAAAASGSGGTPRPDPKPAAKPPARPASR